MINICGDKAANRSYLIIIQISTHIEMSHCTYKFVKLL